MSLSASSLFRHQADRLPVLLITALFVLDVAVYFAVDNKYLVSTWAIVGLAPKACICSWNHHHQHLATFRRLWCNRALEIVYAFHTGITSNAWVLHHNLGHHVNYLDQTKDESGWKDARGQTMSALRYTWTIAITGYVRAYQVGRKHPKYQKTFVTVGTLVAAALALLLWNNPFNGMMVFLIPMLCGYVITCWHTYYHHAGLDTTNPYEASHNVVHYWYNLFTGNLGYHTAHHVKPGLHWSQLPEFHATIAHRIPAKLFGAPCIPFRWVKDRPKRSSDSALAA